MSDLARALNRIDGLYPNPEQFLVIEAAARRQLRFERTPCETCGGDGLPRCKHGKTQMHTHTEWACAGPVGLLCVCGGSGEVWGDELVEVVAKAAYDFVYRGEFAWAEEVEAGNSMADGFRDEARAVLDALADYLTEGK